MAHYFIYFRSLRQNGLGSGQQDAVEQEVRASGAEMGPKNWVSNSTFPIEPTRRRPFLMFQEGSGSERYFREGEEGAVAERAG